MGLLPRLNNASPQHTHRYGRGNAVRRLTVPRFRPHRYVLRIQPQQLADVYQGVISGRAVHIGDLLAVRINCIPRYGRPRMMGSENGMPGHQQSAVLRSGLHHDLAGGVRKTLGQSPEVGVRSRGHRQVFGQVGDVLRSPVVLRTHRHPVLGVGCQASYRVSKNDTLLSTFLNSLWIWKWYL